MSSGGLTHRTMLSRQRFWDQREEEERLVSRSRLYLCHMCKLRSIRFFFFSNHKSKTKTSLPHFTVAKTEIKSGSFVCVYSLTYLLDFRHRHFPSNVNLCIRPHSQNNHQPMPFSSIYSCLHPLPTSYSPQSQ